MSRKKLLDNMLHQIIFLGPALVFFVIFVLVPFITGMYYSFTSWNGVSDEAPLVGLRNFAMIFQDDNFLKAFGFTTRFTLVSVVLVNVCALSLALMLSGELRLRNVFRSVFFLPNVISGLILGFIWQFIFVKVFTAIGEATELWLFGLPWLGTEATGFWATVIVQVWQMAGYLMVIYIAGINSVPRDLVEASTIDGANSLQVFRNVTLPLIMPAMTVSLFMSINSSFKLFDLNYSLTGGNFDTRSVALDIYREAFQSNNYGLGSAKALVFFLAVALITTLQTVYTKRKEVQV